MKRILSGLVIHRWCPQLEKTSMIPIGLSRDGAKRHLARSETVEAFQRLALAAEKEGVRLHVIWAYRDSDLQKEQFEEAKRKHGARHGIRWLAPPGYSEHQTGWALDIGDFQDAEADDNPLFERTQAFQWLKDHARDFGFELSFPPGNWQGVSYEPWHWRFIGTLESSRAFHPSGLSVWIIWTRSLLEALRWWLHP